MKQTVLIGTATIAGIAGASMLVGYMVGVKPFAGIATYLSAITLSGFAVKFFNLLAEKS